MIDMITQKQINGSPKIVPLFKGTKKYVERVRISSGYLNKTTYDIISQHELIIDEKTFTKAKRRTWFSMARFGCLFYLLSVVMTIVLPLILLSTPYKWLSRLAIVVFIIGLILSTLSLFATRSAKDTAEKNLAHWYSDITPLNENEAFFTYEETIKNSMI